MLPYVTGSSGNVHSEFSLLLCLSISKMVKHLPPAVKHLLSLRNPQSYPSPPLQKLNDAFTKTFRDAQLKKAETGWLVLTVGFYLSLTIEK